MKTAYFQEYQKEEDEEMNGVTSLSSSTTPKKFLSSNMNDDKPRIKPRAIVAKDLTDDINLRQCFLGILKDKKNTGLVIKQLSNILPGCGYLKRCSDNRIFLAFTSNNQETDCEQVKSNLTFQSEDELKRFLSDKKFDLTLLENDFIILSLPERQPKTKLQAKNASKCWPINFHPDIHIESILGDNYFNSYQLNAIEDCMRVCIAAAQKGSIGNDICNGSALILDPSSDDPSKVLAVTAARTNEHPMWHAAILAIDLIAKLRGGGTWDLTCDDSTKEKVNDSLSTNEVGNRKRKIAEDILPLSYPNTLKTLIIPKFPNSLRFSDKSSSMTMVDNVDDSTDKSIQYLCTNYWIFLVQEPCPMCSMALLHSRVSMIFYGASNNSYGSLESKTLLHTLPGLNHRYKVWSGILVDECEKLLKDLTESKQIN